RLDARQRSLEVGELRVADRGIGDDTGVLERVAVQGQDPDEGRIEGEVHAGLDLRGSRQASRLRGHHEIGGAEIAHVCSQALRVSQGREHAVMVSGDRQYRGLIVPVRLVELVVVILRLAEAVDDVSEQEIELRNLLRIALGEIRGHLVGDLVLVLRAARAAAIAGGMKNQLAARGYPLYGAGVASQDVVQGQLRLGAAARRGKGQRLDLVRLVQRVDRLVRGPVGRVLDQERGRIGGGFRLREHRFGELPHGRGGTAAIRNSWRGRRAPRWLLLRLGRHKDLLFRLRGCGDGRYRGVAVQCTPRRLTGQREYSTRRQ